MTPVNHNCEMAASSNDNRLIRCFIGYNEKRFTTIISLRTSIDGSTTYVGFAGALLSPFVTAALDALAGAATDAARKTNAMPSGRRTVIATANN
jgi:hypothetical protein